MEILAIDGSYGEGGGQTLRTALSLSVLTARAFRLINIRAGRRNPGLLPQHLSAVRAAAAISGAHVTGDQLASTDLTFSPGHPPRPGKYVFDVAEAAGRGSAGSVTLILQTLLIPLALADGASSLLLRGGTHVEWSPPFDDLASSYLPALQRTGLCVDVELKRFGWFPVGGGEIVCEIAGRSAAHGATRPTPIEMTKRGPLRRISGRAVAANLPGRIPQRMADRARASLASLDVAVEIDTQLVTAACPGAGIFLLAEYQEWPASFSAYGRLGKPSEAVADRTVADLREHHASEAAVELHLADQLLLPLAIVGGTSTFTTLRTSGHLMTNAWTIGQFGVADISIVGGPLCQVRIRPQAWR
jgi:RNA 3'-terminal phosphate cyclase (ATP)